MNCVGPTTVSDIWLFPSQVRTPSPNDFVLNGEKASELGKNAATGISRRTEWCCSGF